MITNQNNQVYKSMRGLVAYLKAQAEAEKAARSANATPHQHHCHANLGYVANMFVVTALPNIYCKIHMCHNLMQSILTRKSYFNTRRPIKLPDPTIFTVTRSSKSKPQIKKAII